MNQYHQINLALDMLLGSEARAIWLCSRVDEQPSHVIAKEFGKTVGEINDILKTCDWAINTCIQVDDPNRVPLPTAVNGFHDIGDGE